ncbi:MAG: protein kinase [Phycisphaerales bacterium]|nr:protein kinase [Phycisphaerales bacterium]MCB9854807.1 protein kinase [Phycisphaerales bacterium]MCB9863721.1 protein kinase [Phycisphaerales bacterium]
MPDANWDEAKAMFLRLRDLQPAERGAILDSQYEPADPLRREIESLLHHHDVANGFLERSALDQIESGNDADYPTLESDDPRIGSTIGRYTVIRRIAAGGMGTVYEAEQDNPRRRVALKLLRREFATGVNARRFAYESQILAHLRHEGIAAVFDAGTHLDNGIRIPYFAMEYLDNAKSITGYASARALPLDQRLRLFVQVCDAVHYGHQHGIIHRDLKPANILVDTSGRSKVIDFGVARTIDSDIATVTLATEAGHILGTPQYMSPEQFDADPLAIDTRSDVYSLGAVLYELIAGRLPYDIGNAPIASVAQIVKLRPPKRLSAIDRKLGGDLQTIVSTAMTKEPDRRYQSAADLARDIERYLDDRPILARPSSMAYNARKFAKRHPAIVASSTIAVMALITASVVSARFAIQASDASRREAIRAKEAMDARDLAERRGAESEFQAYVANISAAAIELRSGGVAEARLRLERTKPELREWEYGYLVGQLDDCERVIENPAGPVYHVSFSTDGRWLASSSCDEPGDGGSQTIWDFESGSRISRIHWDEMTSGDAAFSRDGARFAVCGDQRVEVYQPDVLDKPLFRLEVPGRYMSNVGFTPDNRLLLAVDMGGGFRQWNLDSGELTLQSDICEGGITSYDVSPDGQWFAVTTRDHRIRVYDHAFKNLVMESEQMLTGVKSAHFSRDGNRLAACIVNAGKIVIWNTSDWSIDRTIQTPTGQVSNVAFSPDNQLIAAVGSFKDVLVWNLSTGELIGVGRGHAQHVEDVAFHPSGKWIATAGHDNTIRIWNVESVLQPRMLHGHQRLVRAVRFSPDSTLLATCAFDGIARVWRVADRSLVLSIQAESSRLQDVAFSIDGKVLMLAERDGVVSCWDVSTGKHLRNLVGHTYAVHALAVDPVGRWTASAGIDGKIVLWSMQTGESIGALPGHGQRINGLDCDHTGKFIVSGSQDGTARLWDTTSMTQLRTFAGHTLGIEAVRFSPDGSLIATGSDDHTIKLWNVATGEEVRTLDGHTGGVLELDFSPDGKRLVSSAYDTNVILWDVDRGVPVTSLRGHDAWVWAVDFSPDGKCIASGDGPYGQRDCVVRIWQSNAKATPH